MCRRVSARTVDVKRHMVGFTLKLPHLRLKLPLGLLDLGLRLSELGIQARLDLSHLRPEL
jgi:hypothetical protein